MKFLFLYLIFLSTLSARAELCNPQEEYCPDAYNSHQGSSPAYPSKSSSITLNPSAVPIEKGFGVETLVYKNSLDFSITRGNGRIGAAISPSNNEETFFGPPALELDSDYLTRMSEKTKYNSQKIALATAFAILKNNSSGYSHAQLNLGVIAKYNQVTKNVWPGAGLSAIAGPLSLGYSYSQDEQAFDTGLVGVPPISVKSWTETYSAGLSLSSLALDYSHLTLHLTENDNPIIISQFVASLTAKQFILTAAQRIEDSARPAFDFSNKILITQQIKKEIFGGVQFSATSHILLGAFYNYYLLRELSFGVTLFL